MQQGIAHIDQNCWRIWEDRGFLIHPDPLDKLTRIAGLDSLIPQDALAQIEQTAHALPTLLESGTIRTTLEHFPVYDMHRLVETHDFRIVERLMQMYSYFASAFIYATNQEAEHRLPAGIAVPLVQLAEMVERPPILSYSSYVLANWKRTAQNIVVDDLELVQKFLGNRDEHWFILIHTDIEARATGALNGLIHARDAAENHDLAALEGIFSDISTSINAMLTTFFRMPEHCDSDVYYFRVRPYIFGFNDVVYEGVEKFNGQPQSFRGQTGAQSSIVPALVAGLGLEHEKTALMHHLEIMKDYMPKPHREFIAEMGKSTVRDVVKAHADNSALVEGYNDCLMKLTEFRKQHLHYATTYIAQKVDSPYGTGGTVFMDWLDQLVTETEAQLIR